MAKTNILLVEDESIVAEDIRLSLKSLGYNVVDILASGEDAIKKIEKHKIDLILMDIVLRGKISGIEASSQIRSSFDIPVVYLTAYADEKTLDRAKLTEPHGYILKPFNDRELHSTIETALYRHKMEKRLRENEERFRSIVENSLEGIVILDDNYRFLYVNDEVARISGYSRRELIGEDFRRFLTDESKVTVTDYYQRRQRGDEIPNRYSFDIIRKDGEKRCVEISSSLMKDSSGNVRSVGQILDITERKRSEKVQIVLYQISDAINKTKDTNKLFKTIHSLLSGILDTRNFYIALYDRENDLISLPYCIDEKDKVDSFHAGKSMTKYVIKQKKPLLITEEGIEKLAKKGDIELLGTLSKVWLGVPLCVEGDVIGAVVVQSYTDASIYTKKDMGLLEFVSDQIALALERKRSEDELKKHLDELQLYYNATIGREKRIIELKGEINRLLSELGQDRRYGV